MRKRLPVIIISVALLTNCLGVISRADSGWKSYAQEIDLDTVYTDALEASDYEYEINKGSIGHMYIYTDAFSFSVPKDGEISISFESADRQYFSTVNTDNYMSIYKHSDTRNPVWSKQILKDGFDSSSDTYYKDVKGIHLSKGDYYFTVEAAYGEGDYSFCLSYKPSVPKPSIKSIQGKDNGIKISWYACSGVSGYQIAISTSSSFSSSSKYKLSSSATSKSLSGLGHNKTYYAKVRSIYKVKINGKNKTYYSSWSKKQSVKTK